jgi:hypothetical protein
MAEMRRFVPEQAATLRYEQRLIDSDQWTLQGIIRSNMPMHRIALGDAAGTEYYVSEPTAATASGKAPRLAQGAHLGRLFESAANY